MFTFFIRLLFKVFMEADGDRDEVELAHRQSVRIELERRAPSSVGRAIDVLGLEAPRPSGDLFE